VNVPFIIIPSTFTLREEHDRGWTYLILAGVFEIGFTTFMKMSEGFTRGWPTGSFVVSAIFSFWLLGTLENKTSPLL
jgi:quaternary ammonium compound-resistance protein SugE